VLARHPVGVDREKGREGAARTSLLPVASVISVAFAGSVIVTPLYPLYQQKFGFSEIVLTLIYAAYVVGNVIALLFLGRLSDQVGRKRVSLPGLALAAVRAVLFLLATSTASLFLGRLVLGLSVGILSGTGTAWLAERTVRQRATVIATTANLAGIAIGPLVGGLLAQYGPRPLELPFVAYLVLLAGVAVAVARTAESRQGGGVRLGDLRIRPRVGVPADRLGAFTAPAITGFVIFSLGGLYFALIPTVLRHDLHQRNAAVAGVVVAELALIAIVAITAVARSHRVQPNSAMRAGLAVLLPAAGLVVAAQAARSMPMLVVATGCAGLALGFGYVGSLQVVNELAPDEHRAAVASSYFLACFLGNSVPVIGVGVLSTLTTPLSASVVLACVVGALSIGTLARSGHHHATTPQPSADSRTLIQTQ
jgi:MFS family permease